MEVVKSYWAKALLFIAAILLGQPRLHAQMVANAPEYQYPAVVGGIWFGDPAKDALLANVQVGYAKSVNGHEWTPVRLVLASTTGLGYAGKVIVETNTRGERHSYETDFTVPPSMGSQPMSETVYVGVVLPRERYYDDATVGFRLIGRPLGASGGAAVLQAGTLGSQQGDFYIHENNSPVVLAVGRSSLRNTATPVSNPYHLQQNTSKNDETLEAHILAVEPSDLPFPASRAALYGGVSTVVISQASLRALADAQKQTLRRWAESGGHLVIIDRLIDTAASDLVPAGVVEASMVVDSRRNKEGDASDDGRVALRVTRQGEAHGWSSKRLPTLPDEAAVSGPIGLGWLTILTDDLAGDNAKKQSVAFWKEALQLELIGDVQQSVYESYGQSAYIYWNRPPAQQGVLTVLDQMVDDLHIEPISVWFIFALIAAVGLLVAIGTTFVDWFVLKYPHRRRLSGVTAIGWIAIGSLVALLLPMALRNGETRGFSIQIIDRNEATDATASSELAGIWAAQRLRYQPVPDDGPGWTMPIKASEQGRLGVGGFRSKQYAGSKLEPMPAQIWTLHSAATEFTHGIAGRADGSAGITARIELDPVDSVPVIHLQNELGAVNLHSVTIAFQNVNAGRKIFGKAEEIVSLNIHAGSISMEGDSQRFSLVDAKWNTMDFDGFWMRKLDRDSMIRSRQGASWHRPLPCTTKRTEHVHACLRTGRFAVVTLMLERPSEESAASFFTDSVSPRSAVKHGVVDRWVRIMIPIDEKMQTALSGVYNRGS